MDRGVFSSRCRAAADPGRVARRLSVAARARSFISGTGASSRPTWPSAPCGTRATAEGADSAAPTLPSPEPITGAQSLVRSLEEAGVEVVFGIPGGAILPAYDPLLDSRRSATSWSATSRAPATRPRVTRRRPAGSVSAWRPPGPGPPTWSRRSPTPTWTRCRWSPSPARSPVPSIGTDAFQEADIRGITLPITKHNFLVTNAADIPRAIAEAFHIASTGRPGPVLVDISKDALQDDHDVPLAQAGRPARLPAGQPPARQAGPRGGAADRRGPAQPVLYVGGGVLKARASEELRRLAELTGIPVVTTLMARGAFPDTHPAAPRHARACTARWPRSPRCRRPT